MKIFIIDDDELLSFILKKQFTRFEGLETWGVAKDGEQALSYLENALANNDPLPEIILLDLNMHVMDGWEFLKAIEKHPILSEKAPCICILSSSIDAGDVLKSKNFKRVRHFFSKPLLDDDIAILHKLCS